MIRPLVALQGRKSKLWQEDFLCGPVLLLDLVEDDGQAVLAMEGSQANGWAAVYSQDRARAIELATQVNAGQVLVNRVDVRYDLPMGGRRRAAKGNLFGRDAYDNTVMTKSIFK